ncbi:MAG: Stk1 family PASTA domain-containing Ser/Thr kinase [Chloroflexi bacterium]|nr:Stk1 family PASTA domain-containing Ser/Thr kinase [Chloroflexota bacterium]
MQGRVLNQRYRIDQPLGDGGMARVFLGQDLRLGRRVAIKMLHAQYATDGSFLRRFHHEAQAAARLHHPAIVDVYDVGQDGDVHYIVMEYIDGDDLKTVITRGGRLSLDQALDITAAAADALEAAHRSDMVHRDVKPQNIMLARDGTVKLADFGIAKSLTSNSNTDTIFGTADYISPEQARGLPVAPQTDLYSLGVTLFELLTGQLPFHGDTAVAVAMQHVSAAPPPLRSVDERIPPAIEALVLMAMAKDPEDRPASAREFARALRSLRGGDRDGSAVRAMTPIRTPAASRPTVRIPPTPRTPLPAPRSAAAAAPLPAGGAVRDFGLLALGLIVLGVVLALVYLFVSGVFDGLFAFSGAPRPAVPTMVLPTATPDSTPTSAPTVTLQRMPSLIGRDERDALTVLDASGIRALADPPRYDEAVAEGVVIDQFPPPGGVIDATLPVTYVVSLGPEQLTLPSVVTMRVQDADFQLRGMDLNVQVIEASDAMSEGFVFRTAPEAGATLRRGDVVTLYVSLGDKVRMPEVTGLPEADARALIEQLGLFVSYSDYQGCDKLGALCERYGPGVVVSSVPRTGELIARGDGVTLGVRAP